MYLIKKIFEVKKFIYKSLFVEKFISSISKIRGSVLVSNFILKVLPFSKKVNFSYDNGKVISLDLSIRSELGFVMNDNFESCIFNFIKQNLKSNDTFVDIGANWGMYSFLKSDIVGNFGKVIAIEANPVTFANLIKKIEENKIENISALNYALSYKCGETVTVFLP